MLKNSKILIYGAGVIGSIFAGKLANIGYNITVLARNKRLKEIEQNGIVLINAITNKKLQSKVKVIENLEKDDIYDYIIVTVQNTQIDDILPILSINLSKNIVFVVNQPLGYQKWIDVVGYERIMIGFPSAGGERKDGKVNYFIGKGLAKIFQSTTFGELNGKNTERLNRLIEIFTKSGFSPSTNKKMDFWQKTHVGVIIPIAKAHNKFSGNNYRLAKSYKTIKNMILATRECFRVLYTIGGKITPFKLNFYYLPLFIIVPIFMILFRTKIVEFSMAKHTITGKKELKILENQLRILINKTGLDTPYLDSLEK